MSCIIAYCVCEDCSMPQLLVQLLQSIPVRFTNHETSEHRLLQTLIESAEQLHANRKVQCPNFLAKELNRCTIQTQDAKSLVKLYQQRMATAPHTPAANTHGGLCDQNHEPDEDVRKSYEDVNSGCAEVHLARWPLGCRPCHVPIF